MGTISVLSIVAISGATPDCRMVGSSKDTQTGVFEGLDMLAAIATQELQSNADEKR